jgi:uncharacterized membrane protein YraQ (UPF0718 family)
MKLQKSVKGRFLIVLYYTAFGVTVLFLTVFLAINIGILISLIVCFLLGIAGGVLGGELEYIEHRNVLHKKYSGRKQPVPPNRIIPFPAKENPKK